MESDGAELVRAQTATTIGNLKIQQNVYFVQHVQLVVLYFGLLIHILDQLLLLMHTDLFLIQEMKEQSKDWKF